MELARRAASLDAFPIARRSAAAARPASGRGGGESAGRPSEALAAALPHWFRLPSYQVWGAERARGAAVIELRRTIPTRRAGASAPDGGAV